MAGNRQKAQALCLEYIDKILPGSGNRKIYEDLFASMSDEAFEAFIGKLKSGQARLALIAPNMAEPKLSVERNLAIAKELGHEFFQRIWMDGKAGAPKYLSAVPYLVVDLPLRRQAQLLVKKISIPEDNRSVDNLTGQPTGASKGSKISYPEIQILAALGLDDSITELIKYRGGDQKGFIAMNDSIARTGGVSQKALEPLGTKVKVTQTLSTYLTAMHLKSTLDT
jgi:hypothetical protein